MPRGNHAGHNREGILHYAIIATIEETLEILAVARALAGLIHCSSNYSTNLSVAHFHEPKTS